MSKFKLPEKDGVEEWKLNRKFQLEQLVAWVDGNPIHDEVNDQCCPDFSCCTDSHEMAPREVRELF